MCQGKAFAVIEMAESNEDNDEKNYFPKSKKNDSDVDNSDDENYVSNPKPDIGLGSRSRHSLRKKTFIDIHSITGYARLECRIIIILSTFQINFKIKII